MKNRAVFFDRDGIINQDLGYVASEDRLEFLPEFFELYRVIPRSIKKFIVTNQAGIARGYYSEEQFHEFMKLFEKRLRLYGVTFDGYSYCPHHPVFTGQCNCRKPKPGMILDILIREKLEPSECVLIGDKVSDIQAGNAANLGMNILVRPEQQWKSNNKSTYVVDSFHEAKILLRSHFEGRE